MRIRKLPIAVSWKNTGALSCREEEERFLRPLVQAAMDIQAKAKAETDLSGDLTPQPTVGRAISQIEGGIQHKWRNALLHCNSESEEAQVSGEGEESNFRSNGVIRKKLEDKVGWSTSMEKDLCAVTVKKKRSKQLGTVIGHLSAGREKKEEGKGNNKNNRHEGSQCRRRNGRGWRCSQQTLVGYCLCEHHLGKARFKSVNPSSSDTAILGNSKVSKFKELHLIEEAVSCEVRSGNITCAADPCK